MKLIIGENNINKRIDKFLREEVFLNMEITRGKIARQIKEGKVLVNDKKVKPSYLLKENDRIEINISEKKEKIKPNKNIELDIIYQDENIIVINKPAGIQVHPDYNEEENTIVNALINKFPEIGIVGDNSDLRPGIVHRLDKDTSGILVVARNQGAFIELKKQFQERKISKKYLAVVFGSLGSLGSLGVIDKPLARSTKYKKQVVAGKKTKTRIREAVTEYRVLRELDEYSLVELTPKTGRFHQIRVHMKSIGHPVVGDKIYKSKNTKNKNLSDRQLLHAFKLEFNLFEAQYQFEAPIPEDFREFLAQLDYQSKRG